MSSDLTFKVAVAESCTGGNIQRLITQNGGVSQWFQGGLTAYNIDMKVKHLDVEREVAQKCDCVSETVAKQMAKGVAKKFNANVGISTTGYVHYNNPISKYPVAYIGIYKDGLVYSIKHVVVIEDMKREDIQLIISRSAFKYFKDKFLIVDESFKLAPNYDHLVETLEKAID